MPFKWNKMWMANPYVGGGSQKLLYVVLRLQPWKHTIVRSTRQGIVLRDSVGRKLVLYTDDTSSILIWILLHSVSYSLFNQLTFFVYASYFFKNEFCLCSIFADPCEMWEISTIVLFTVIFELILITKKVCKCHSKPFTRNTQQ